MRNIKINSFLAIIGKQQPERSFFVALPKELVRGIIKKNNFQKPGEIMEFLLMGLQV